MAGNLAIANGCGQLESGIYDGYSFLKLTAANGANTTRIQIETGAGRKPFIERIIGGVKSAEHIATATPPQEYDLPLAAGISAISPSTYCKTQDGFVGLTGWVSGANAPAQGASVPIATLPAGYRPGKYVRIVAVASASAPSLGIVRLEVGTDGAIKLVAWNGVGTISAGISLDDIYFRAAS